VAGVGGGGADRGTIILTGMAGLVAGAFSMALGEFASVDTQNDAVAHEVRVERDEIDRHPEDEKAELADMYQQMGLTRPTAEALPTRSTPTRSSRSRCTSSRSWASTRTTSPHPGRPRSARSWRSRSGDLPAGLVPARVVVAARGVDRSAAVGLFAAGAITSRFTTRSWWLSGCGQLMFGAIAAGATYLVGMAIGVSAG
jgi:hypothetical protein